MHHSAIYDPRRSATTEQLREAAAQAARRQRMAAAVPLSKPIEIAPAPTIAEAAPVAQSEPAVAPPIPNSLMMAAHRSMDRLIPMSRIEVVQRSVLQIFPEISLRELKSGWRFADIVRARQIAMYLARSMTGQSLPEIGRRFGGRDHTTVLHAVRKIATQIQADKVLAKQVADARAIAENRLRDL
ncbi:MULTISPECIES: helix-turn-helix domain-containing protein [unclassified Bradyrhizobium]